MRTLDKNELSRIILDQARNLKYRVSDLAPQTEVDLFNNTSLVIWSGASDNTIFNNPRANWAFRAIHDDLHLKTGIGFTPAEEIELGRIQASKYNSSLMQELIYCEVAGQAEYFMKNGIFVKDQISFTINYLTERGI